MSDISTPEKLKIENIIKAAEELGLKENKRVSSTIYHYTNLKSANAILKGATFKLSDPKYFNDPFDMHTDIINYDPSLEQLMKFCKVEHVGIEAFERHLISKGIDESNRVPYFKNIIQQSIKKQKDQMGVVCYSETCFSPLMWSHYADKHKGISIGFKYKSLDGSFLMPIVYKKVMTPVNYWESDAKLYVFLGFMKSHVWQYEKEVRLLCTNVQKHCGDSRMLPFDKSLVKEIRVGFYAPEKTEEEIYNLLRNNGYDYQNIHIERMRINSTTYSFDKRKAK